MSQIDIIDELKGIAQYLGDNDMTNCLRVVNRALKEIQDGRDYTVEEVNRIKAELQKTLNAGAVWEGAYREAEQENAKLRERVAELLKAATLFRLHGLPPHDVSGSAAWDKAIELLKQIATAPYRVEQKEQPEVEQGEWRRG